MNRFRNWSWRRRESAAPCRMNRHQANRIVIDGSIALRRHAIAYCAALCLPLLAELSIATESTRGGEHFTGKAGNYIFSVCKIGGGASSILQTEKM